MSQIQTITHHLALLTKDCPIHVNAFQHIALKKMLFSTSINTEVYRQLFAVVFHKCDMSVPASKLEAPQTGCTYLSCLKIKSNSNKDHPPEYSHVESSVMCQKSVA